MSILSSRPTPDVLSRARLHWLLPFLFGAVNSYAGTQTAKDEVDAAKNVLDLRIYQATADSVVAQREAEARLAIAEAQRAELLARLPPTSAKALDGSVNTEKFGAAGLVKAFDLAQQLATDICTALPADRKTVIYEAAASQGVLAARTVNEGIARLSADLAEQSTRLQLVIDQRSGQAIKKFSLVPLAVIPAAIKAVADITSLFKTDVTATGISYGDGARSMFATGLAMRCPDKLAGLGSGYLGELDTARHDELLARVRALLAERGAFENRIAMVQKLADAAKGDEKKDLAAIAVAASGLLKTVDAFVDSLKAGEASEKSPLFNTTRYLGYANRTAGALVLDFDLRLEGMTIVKDNLFTGQHLRLSGAAFLWYRLYEPDGTLRLADTVRRITAPVDVDLRGRDIDEDFWDGSPGRGEISARGR